MLSQSNFIGTWPIKVSWCRQFSDVINRTSPCPSSTWSYRALPRRSVITNPVQLIPDGALYNTWRTLNQSNMTAWFWFPETTSSAYVLLWMSGRTYKVIGRSRVNYTGLIWFADSPGAKRANIQACQDRTFCRLPPACRRRPIYCLY